MVIRRLLRGLLYLLATTTVLLVAVLLWLWPRSPFDAPIDPPFSLQRHPGNPVIHAGLHPQLAAASSEGGYVNINGPSVIRVPDWVNKPLHPSLRGEIDQASHELRDPFLFRDSNGLVYLYYTGAGEQAIGVATVDPRGG